MSVSIIEAFKAFVVLGVVGLFVVYALTFWAIGKSRERAECYRHAKVVEDCPQPGAVERLIRAILAPTNASATPPTDDRR